MMRIPQALVIGGHTYRVVVGRFSERDDLAGQTRHRESVIQINAYTGDGKRCARSQLEETFVHELLHCVDRVYNANTLSEETILRVAEGLYQVLTANQLWRS